MEIKQAKLEQIAADILERNVCPDLAKQATRLVMGDGNPDSDIVFIGEAPGKKEDETGLPFMGAAGNFLNTMLESAGLQRKDVYITNIVKYRPPNNRDPLAQEKADFLPYLLKQLDVIKPKIVITLGRHSMEYFLPGVKIGEIHGQIRKIQLEGRSMVIMPLFHPAAALYNGSLRQTLIDDFLRVPGVINTLK